jgi:HSP20 family protein
LRRSKTERSRAGVFIAVTDIFETDQALTVVLEMPGVNKDSVDVRVENDVLSVEGHVDFSNYAGLQPVYTEYNGRQLCSELSSFQQN